MTSSGPFDQATAGSDSSLGGHQVPAYVRSCALVFCALTMALGIVGNLMVPVVILKTKDMRNSTNVFLMNLSLADLLVLLVCIPTVLVEVNSRPDIWQLGKEMCAVVPFVEMTAAHASVLTILAISFEPLRAGYVCTNFRAVCICAMSWLSAGIFTSRLRRSFQTKFNVKQYIERKSGKVSGGSRSPKNPTRKIPERNIHPL